MYHQHGSRSRVRVNQQGVYQTCLVIQWQPFSTRNVEALFPKPKVQTEAAPPEASLWYACVVSALLYAAAGKAWRTLTTGSPRTGQGSFQMPRRGAGHSTRRSTRMSSRALSGQPGKIWTSGMKTCGSCKVGLLSSLAGLLCVWKESCDAATSSRNEHLVP